LQHRFQRAFCLAQPQAKHQAQRQGGLDCQIGIAVLATASLTSWSLPRRQGIRCQLQGQAASSAKTRLVLRPVRHPEPRLLNMMEAAGIVFERHRGTTTAIAGSSRLTQTAERSMHQRPCEWMAQQ
jgi:hypothetical protein